MRNQKWSRRDILKTATHAYGGSFVRRGVTGGPLSGAYHAAVFGLM